MRNGHTLDGQMGSDIDNPTNQGPTCHDGLYCRSHLSLACLAPE